MNELANQYLLDDSSAPEARRAANEVQFSKHPVKHLAQVYEGALPERLGKRLGITRQEESAPCSPGG